MMMIDRERKPGTWTTRSGQVIKIRDMSNQHLGHAIRLLRRLAKQRRPEVELDATSFAVSCRGDMATYYTEGDANALHGLSDVEFCDYLYGAVYEELTEEAGCRDLRVAYDASTVRISAQTLIDDLRNSKL